MNINELHEQEIQKTRITVITHKSYVNTPCKIQLNFFKIDTERTKPSWLERSRLTAAMNMLCVQSIIFDAIEMSTQNPHSQRNKTVSPMIQTYINKLISIRFDLCRCKS